jgi:transcriptional regulator with XRE-family HTH domain
MSHELMFRLAERRYYLDGPRLRAERHRLGFTVKEFAGQCGWSHQYQSQLECGLHVTVSEETRNVVLQVIRSRK